MKKYTFLFAFLMLLSAFAFVGCGSDDDDDDAKTEDVASSVTLVSVTPADGSKDVANGTQVVITMSGDVKINYTSGSVKVNGEEKSAASLTNNKGVITLKAFDIAIDETYEVVIAAGTIKGYDKEIKVTFSGETDKTVLEAKSTSPLSGNQKVYPGRPVKVTYTKNIVVAGDITVNGKAVEAKADGKVLTVIAATEASTEYLVSIPEGAITDTRGNKAPKLEIEFVTTDGSVNPLVNGNETAQKLFSYMNSIYGEKILSGAIANVSVKQVEAGLVKDLTGKTPAMLTIDYIFSNLTKERSSWEQASIYKKIDVYKEHSDKNGIVSACWHLNVPSAEKYAAWNKVNGTDAENWNAQHYFSAKEAVKAGTWQNDFLEFSLAQVIEDLKLFKDADIPVVWRPFHEAAGNACISGKNSDAWFWWGKDGAEAYKALWVYMFDKFKAAGLDNLIWVWTTQTGLDHGNGWYCTDDSNWYPGDEYVDIVARDMYDCTKASLCADEFDVISDLFPGKLVTLGENGNMAKISDAWNAGAKFLYFMPWYHYSNEDKPYDLDQSEHANKAWWQDAAKCENVLFLEDMPNWRD